MATDTEIRTALRATDEMSPVLAKAREELDKLAAAEKLKPLIVVGDVTPIKTAADRIKELERTLQSWQRVAARGGTITAGDLSQIRAAEGELKTLQAGMAGLTGLGGNKPLAPVTVPVDTRPVQTARARVAELRQEVDRLQAEARGGTISVGGVEQLRTARAEMQALRGELNLTHQGLQSFGNAASSFGLKMSIGVTAPLVLLGKRALTAASDATESFNKMQVVFGNASNTISRLAETSAEDLGMSQRVAVEAAASFGNLFNSVGLAKQPAADMSASLVKLAADLASFNNIDPAEALEKLRAGLIGQAEPLRAVGVLLNETAVAQEAVRLKLARSTGEVSDAAKVQARYSLILQQTQTAQGDFARTADGLANSTRTAKAQLDDAAASLGQALIPMATAAAKEVGRVADAFANLSPGAQQAIVDAGLLTAALGPLSSGLGAVAKVAPLILGFLGAGGGLAVAFAAAVGSLVAGVLLLSDQAKAVKPEDANRVLGLPTMDVLQARLNNVQSLIAVARANLKANPDDADELISLSSLSKQEAEIKATMQRVAASASEVQHTVHRVNPLAALDGAAAGIGDVNTALANSQGYWAAWGDFAEQAALRASNAAWAARSAMGYAQTPYEETGPEQRAAAAAAARSAWARNQARVLGGGSFTVTTVDEWFGAQDKANQTAAKSFQSAYDKAAQQTASRFESYISAARGALKGLLPDMGLGGSDLTTPGANGPFENIFRAADVAKNGAVSPWAKVLGLDQESAKRIVDDFYRGAITPEVEKLIDTGGLINAAQLATQAENLKAAYVAKVAKAAGTGTTVVEALMGTQTQAGEKTSPAEQSIARATAALGDAFTTQVNADDFKKAIYRNGVTTFGYFENGFVDQANTSRALQAAIDGMVASSIARQGGGAGAGTGNVAGAARAQGVAP